MAAHPPDAEPGPEASEPTGSEVAAREEQAPATDRRRMPPWLPRALVLTFLLLGAFQVLDWAAHRLIGLLVVLFVAFFVSLAMEPAVDSLAARGMSRGLGTAVVFVLVFLFAAGFVVALGTLLVETVHDLVIELPRLVNDSVDWVNRTFNQEFTLDQLRGQLTEDTDTLTGYAEHAAGHVWGLSATIVGGLAKVLLIALFSIYLTAGGPKLRHSLCSLLPPAKQGAVLHAWDLAIQKTGGYLYSRALLAVISAVAHGIFLAVLGVPNAIAMGVWFGVVASFVPTFGTYLAGALPVLVALTIRPLDAVWVILFVVVYQQLQDYVLQPKLTARTVDVNPAVALLAVLAGGALLGAVGALLAIPATATVQSFVSLYLKRYEVTEDPRIDRAQAKRVRRAGTDPAT
ncbi:AI-2E family transporter [Nocardia lijiangensis]|uniref:AI-2E family transporter n=1 Tax=Nocardia lijiangensis TaxID=299618 RepID=UPI00082E3A94|nr:AI-2E family transporter [Nocardia lijiangensis]